MVIKKAVKRVQEENELGARRAVLEDLFFDFNASRTQVYKMNFFRGIFFGVGTVIGGTILVALIVWLLSWFTDIPGGIGEFIQYVVNTVQSSKKM